MFHPRPRAGGDGFLVTYSFVWAQRRARANLSVSGPALEAAWGIIRKCCRSSNGLRSGRKVRLFGSRLGSRSLLALNRAARNQRPVEIRGRLRADVFDAAAPVCAEIVVAQGVPARDR